MVYFRHMASRVGSVVGYVFIDLFGSFVRFPVWWYTAGFFETARSAKTSLGYSWRSLDISLWIKNFFVPMYGAYDWPGRLISILMRFVVIIGRLIYFVVEASLAGIGLALWLAAPIVFFWLFAWSFYVGAFVQQVQNYLS